MPKITEKHRRQLLQAASHDLGLITFHSPGSGEGLRRAAFEKGMKTLCGLGLMQPYVHGGYEITELGRTELSIKETQE